MSNPNNPFSAYEGGYSRTIMVDKDGNENCFMSPLSEPLSIESMKRSMDDVAHKKKVQDMKEKMLKQSNKNELLPSCFCGEVNNLLRCSRCKVTNYCSPNCQGEDWKKHKNICAAQAAAKIDIEKDKAEKIWKESFRKKNIAKGMKDTKFMFKNIAMLQENDLFEELTANPQRVDEECYLNGNTALWESCASGKHSLSTRLIDEFNANVNFVNKQTYDVNILTKQHINKKNMFFSVLHTTCACVPDINCKETALLLVSKGARIDVKDAKGRTPLDVIGLTINMSMVRKPVNPITAIELTVFKQQLKDARANYELTHSQL